MRTLSTSMLVVVLLMIFIVQPLVATVVYANPDQYLEQLADENSGNVRAWDDLEGWVAGILVKFIEFLQNISPLIILFAMIIGAFMFLAGALLSSRSLRNAGGTGIFVAVLAYLIIKNAPAILLMIQDLATN